MRLPLSEIRVDERIQPRVELDEATVTKYAELLTEAIAQGKDDAFPPVDVFKDEGGYLLAHGFHRYAAHVKVQTVDIAVVKHEGTWRHAQLFAIKANAENPKAYEPRDLKKIAFMLLSDPEVRKLTNAAIVDLAGKPFSYAYFGRVRKEWESVTGLPTPIRIASDGRQINTTNLVGPKKVTGSLLEAVQFVKQGMSTSGDVSFFDIQNRRILASNGHFALSSPFPVDIACRPNATAFLKAVEACEDELELEYQPDGSLLVRGQGKSVPPIKCSMQTPRPAVPTGEDLNLGPGFLAAVKKLEPFCKESGIHFQSGTAYATYGVEVAMECGFPSDMTLSTRAVQTLVNIGVEPVRVQSDGRFIAFHYPGDRWLWSELFRSHDRLLEGTFNGLATPIPDGFFQAMDYLSKFSSGYNQLVFFHEGCMSTSRVSGTGATVMVPGLRPGGCFNMRAVRSLEGVARTLDLVGEELYFTDGDLMRGKVPRPFIPLRQREPDGPATKSPLGMPPWAEFNLEQFAQRHGLDLREVDGEQVALVREDDLAEFR